MVIKGANQRVMDTTGTVWPERQRFLHEMGFSVDETDLNNRRPFGMNWKMTLKTILIQMHHKSETFEHLNKHLVLFRNGESKIIRLKSQEQFNRIIEMNRAHIPSEILFRCVIEYETMADQTINYIYEVSIQNDTIINVISDGVVSEEDTNKNRKIPTTQSVFRNLQDSISTIDRSAYAWQKMGESQVRALYLFMQNMQCNTTGTNTNEKEQNHS